ncbi:cellulose biosynthesis protein BcsS [Altererythrobacter soli]|uniref:Cellulose biosynthesis protein BcsS n=1 Tax=Croceibacterium soli TaxID=1739690 RepID=A0A6I4UT40_9SPHN|nr:cellulose biosynthesis protein BcsS [Croceibacterium soli]MXP42080.1 cellulose biosynthesis protein BcsS [Croceibacterium soli]
MQTIRSLIRSVALAAMIAASAPSIAEAQDSGVVYAGGAVSEGQNIYAGAVVALPGARLGSGLAVRGGVSAGRYEYRTNAVEIEGKYTSAELAFVHQSSGDWGWANFGVGPRVTDTELEPADSGNERVGTRWDVALQTDGAVGNRWRLGWFGSLGVLDKAYITELRAGRLLSEQSQTRAGVEAGVQGDDTYTRGSLGLFVSTMFAEKSEVRISGGLSEQAGRNAKPYAALSLSRTF